MPNERVFIRSHINYCKRYISIQIHYIPVTGAPLDVASGGTSSRNENKKVNIIVLNCTPIDKAFNMVVHIW